MTLRFGLSAPWWSLLAMTLACGTSDTTQVAGTTTPTTPDDPNPSIVDLLPDQVATLTDSVAGPFTFTVPENAISVTISVNGPTNGYVTLGEWRDPTGFELVDSGWTNQDPTLCLACNNRIASAEGAFAAIAPNNPSSRLNAGEHTFSVYGFRLEGGFFNQELLPLDGTIEIRVQAKVLPEAPQTGTLDLNLHFTGAQGLTAESAQNDPTFKRRCRRSVRSTARSVSSSEF